MINLLPEEMRGEEKKKEAEESKEIKMTKPTNIPPKVPEPPKPFKSPEPSEPQKPIEPQKPPEIKEKVEPVKPLVPEEKKPEPPLSPPKFGRPEEIFKAEKSESKERPKEREKWTLPQPTEKPTTGPLEVSLSPEKVIILPRMVRKRIITLLVWLMIMLIIFTGVWWWAINHLKTLATEVEEVQAEIKITEGQINPLLEVKSRITKIESKFSQAQKVLSRHIYWTKFFKLLETYTIPRVSFQGFSANTSGSIHLKAQALDLPAVGRQIIVFQEAEDFIDKVGASNIIVRENGVTFNLDLSLKPDVFYLED